MWCMRWLAWLCGLSGGDDGEMSPNALDIRVGVINKVRQTEADRQLSQNLALRLPVEHMLMPLILCVGQAWKHPDSDKLWCEEIDLGEAEPRQIASGLRHFYAEESDLTGQWQAGR